MDQVRAHDVKTAHPPRYRLENGEPCVDIRLAGIEHFFDGRDPAPFRQRDLDPDLADYLRDAGDDLLREKHLRIIFWLERACQPGEIEEAFRAHFEYENERIARRGKQRRRTGQIALVLALVLLSGLLSLSRLVESTVPGFFGAVLKEGLVIAGWVVLWRPVEILLFDWIPERHQRLVVDKLLQAAIEVRMGQGPA
jgi:hypothetical protein